ncbi:MAG: VCBS repeat-containing protein [Planctomycetota bacterium]
MRTARWTFALLTGLLGTGIAIGQNAQAVHWADADAAIPGAATVTEHIGWLPPANLDVEIPQMAGFPVQMGCQYNFKPNRGVVLADLDGDRKLEIIAGSTDSKLYAWDYLGKPMPGFPVTLNNWIQNPPSVADLEGDGDLEIVVATRGMTDGGRLYVIDHLGRVVPPFPISVNNNNMGDSPTLYDLDGDGRKEIIVGERAHPIGYLHVFRHDGTQWGGSWPAPLDHVPTGAAAVGDMNRDGVPEIFYTSYNSMYVFGLDGKAMPGWPKQIPNANFSYQSAALADLDGDKDLEIVVGAHKDAAGCYVFHHDGTPFPGWPRLVGTWTYCPPTVTDLENDGQLEIIDGRAGYGPGSPSACFWVWSANGAVRPGFPYVSPYGGGSEGPLTVADIDGDGVKEIFADSNIKDGVGGFLYGVSASGQNLPGFPLRPAGFTYMNGATIGDVDGDGDYELAVVSYEDYVVWVNLYDLPYPYVRTGGEWKVYHARNRRGGLFSRWLPGDLNCDGQVDFGDINPFVLALTNPAGYAAAFPHCDLMNGDINDDGKADFGDINPFVRLLTGP